MEILRRKISEVKSQYLHYETPGSSNIVSTGASPRIGGNQTLSTGRKLVF